MTKDRYKDILQWAYDQPGAVDPHELWQVCLRYGYTQAGASRVIARIIAEPGLRVIQRRHLTEFDPFGEVIR